MTVFVRRAGAFAAVGTVAVAAPALGRYAAVPFLAVAGLAAFVLREGPLFELFARPGDRQDGTLYGLAGFSLGAAGLALLVTMPVFGMPAGVFVATVLLLVYGNLGEMLVLEYRKSAALGTLGFGLLGAAGAGAGLAVADAAGVATAPPPALGAFLIAAGTVLAGLLRSVLFARDDPLVLLTVGLLLWFLAALADPPTLERVAVSLGVVLAFGAVA
ncbi:MAG: DUF92 domain-containing protein, partial [Halobacteriales archaeon]